MSEQTPSSTSPDHPEAEAPGIVPLHRPARLYPEPVPTEALVIAAPPPIPSKDRGGWVQILFPLVGSLGMVAFALAYKNILFLAVAGAIAILTTSVWIAMRVQQRRSAKRQRRDNTVRYREYLAENRERLQEITAKQRRALQRVHPDTRDIWSLATTRRNLWERRLEDDDFMRLRIGLGSVPLATPVSLEERTDPLVRYEPELLAEAKELVESLRTLRLAPVTVRTRSIGSLAIVGDLEAGRALARAMVCEMSAFHAPQDLRLVAWFAPEHEPSWGWMKWLPHARESALAGADEGRAVTLAVDPSDLEVLLGEILRPRLAHLERAREAGPQAQEVSFQQVAVIIDDYDPASPIGRMPALDELLTRAREIGVFVLTLVSDPERVPSSIGARAELAQGGWLSYTESAPEGRREQAIAVDGAEVRLCEAVARAVAPLRLRVRTGRTTTVESEGLLDLLGVPDPKSFDPDEVWSAGPGRDLLRTPIGVGDDGSAVFLDVKEAAEGGMGPHGLLVGATGSGKSELLRTLVTGLAVTHSPEDLAVVLVDYKGGATFAELEALPQVAGTITNLERDLTLVDRMREALFGELERRQRVLQDTGHFDRVREYQAHRRKHAEEELPPLPSLLLVVDEFGELLTTRPDFLDLFVSVGRTGRSLGIHLLLATQRLDEGRITGLQSHLRYRVCLRTFSPEESMVALGTRQAFDLPPLPGLGYLKVDRTVERFKAALATRAYREHRQFAEAPAPVVRSFAAGGPVQEVAVLRRGNPGAQPGVDRLRQGLDEPLEAVAAGAEPRPQPRGRTEMQVIIESLARVAGAARRVRAVWLPPLPEALSLDAVLPDSGSDHAPGSPGWLRVPVGLRDSPRDQAQSPFSVDFTGTGGHLAVVGAPRTGKSLLLSTLVASLALTHDPGDVQVYLLDFGGGGLLSLSGLPHVGAVHGRGDGEEARRLVREMQSIVGDRVAAFRQHRVEGMPAYHRARQQGQIPGSRHGEVLLVVDNWAQFAQDFPELEPDVMELAATGLHYGVHLVLASNRWNDFRLALRDNMGGRLELRLNDPLDSEIDRHAARALPDRTPGRGIRPGGEQVQIALPRVDGQADAGGLAVGVEGVVAEAGSRWRKSKPAAPVRMLPARVTPADLPDAATDHEPGVAIGIEEFSLGPVHADLFDADPHFLVFGDGECGKTTLLRAWISGLAAKYPPDRVRIAVLDYRRMLLECAPESHLYGYTCTPEMAHDLASRLTTELQGRLPSPGLSAEDLRRRRWWSGPEIALFVDDYDLVAGPSGSPLSELVELLAQGRDVGFHVVLARRVGGTARSAFEPFLQRIRELSTPGLVMSGDPTEGPIIGEQKAQPLPPGRGYLVRRRRTTLVQTVLAEEGESGSEAVGPPEPGRAAEEPARDRARRRAWRPAS